MIRTLYRIVVLSLLVWQPLSTWACDFECTLKRHLDAIQKQDYPAFESTLTRDETLTLIYLSGRTVTSSAQYRKEMQEWFAEKGWTFKYEILRTVQTKEMGLALLKVNYEELDKTGKPIHADFYLNLVFRKEPHGWALFHDQNTRLPEPKKS